MGDADEYEKLLREIEQFTAGSKGGSTAGQQGKSLAPVPTASNAVESTGPGGRLRWAGVAGLAGLALGSIFGLLLGLLPFIGPIETGLGAAFGAALTAYVSGPPAWFKGR